jgi:hypothetical protein
MSGQTLSKALHWVAILGLLGAPTLVAAEGTGPGPAVSAQSALWPQTDNPGNNVAESSEFTTLNIYDSQAADDFLVPTGTSGTWTIEQITADGAYADANPATSVNVFIYQDNNGLPGAGVYTGTNLAPTGGLATGDFVISTAALVPAWILSRGTTYWVSVQANMPNISSARWQWTERTVQSLQPSVWRDPVGLFHPACINWQRRAKVCNVPDPSSGPDLVFAIEGLTTIVGAGPRIFNTDPTSLNGGGGNKDITINGSDFGNSSGALAKWEGNPLSTTWVSDSVLTAIVPAADLTTAGVYSVTVSVGAQTSNNQQVQVQVQVSVGSFKIFLPLIRR